MIDRDRLAAYKAILRTPTDPAIEKRLRSRITAPILNATQARIKHYLRHATAWLMHRDLDRDGDL